MDGEWQPFETVRASFPDLPPEPKATSENELEQATLDEDMYSRNPWLVDYMKFGDDGGPSPSKDFLSESCLHMALSRKWIEGKGACSVMSL